MKTYIQILLITISFFSSEPLFAQDNTSSKVFTIEPEDIHLVLGKWIGTLSYLDYNSGELYTMPCELDIKEKKKNRALSLDYKYPNEPKANSKETLKFSKKGDLINKKKIVSKSINSEGILVIITEHEGKDGNENKKAKIKTSYLISEHTLVLRKEVQFKNSSDWILRNEYKFKKSKGLKSSN